MRRLAREVAVQVVFATLFCEQTEGLKRALCKNNKLKEDDVAYIDGVLAAVDEHKGEEEEIIDKISLSFSAQRVFPVDKSILYVAIAEILYCGVPYRVVCNEAANIATKYSTDKSASYVTGILSEVIKLYVHAD